MTLVELAGLARASRVTPAGPRCAASGGATGTMSPSSAFTGPLRRECPGQRTGAPGSDSAFACVGGEPAMTGDRCVVCGAGPHRPADTCVRCKRILDRVETRRDASGGLRRVVAAARLRALAGSWRDGAFHCFYTGVCLIEDHRRWRGPR